jgi:hypothetical protein
VGYDKVVETVKWLNARRIRRMLKTMKMDPPKPYRRYGVQVVGRNDRGPRPWSPEPNRATRRGFGLSHVPGYPSAAKRSKARAGRKTLRAHRRRMAAR